MLRRTLGEQVRLETALDEDLWPALADANQFENAILNLAINARDAMPDGGRLTISTRNATVMATDPKPRQHELPGSYVVVRVTDSGSGMAPEVVAKVFEPFFTTKPIGQGTGLGLSMIYGFVRQSGGYVRIESGIGRGTTVALFLPRSTADAVATEVAKPQASPQGNGETVLVVEDDATVRLLIIEVLEELGYLHFHAAEAKGALAIINAGTKIDLIVTDVGLPGMDGRALAMLAQKARPGLKVLLVTGYAEKAKVRVDFLGPDMDILLKPFTLDALGLKIKEMIMTCGTASDAVTSQRRSKLYHCASSRTRTSAIRWESPFGLFRSGQYTRSVNAPPISKVPELSASACVGLPTGQVVPSASRTPPC